jgi:hypothetical protein
VVPTATLVPSESVASDHHGIPVVAVIILAIAGGLIGLFVLWRLYKAVWRFRHSKETSLLPRSVHSRDMTSHRQSSSALLPFAAQSETSLNALARPYYRFRDSGSFSTLSHHPDEKGSDSPESPSTPSSATLLAAGSPEVRPDLNSNMSTNYLRSNVSRQSMSSIASPAPSNSRASVISNGQRRSGVQSFAGSNRLSGAPHSPYSRVEIVPPQPLGVIGNSVVATDKATLNFSDQSGIGDDRETLFDPVHFEKERQHVRSSSADQLSAARAAYLAEGPAQGRRTSFYAVGCCNFIELRDLTCFAGPVAFQFAFKQRQHPGRPYQGHNAVHFRGRALERPWRRTPARPVALKKLGDLFARSQLQPARQAHTRAQGGTRGERPQLDGVAEDEGILDRGLCVRCAYFWARS